MTNMHESHCRSSVVRSKHRYGLMLGALVLGLSVLSCGTATRPTLTVAAASSLHPFLERIRPNLERRWNLQIRIYYGASRIITRQIEAGAAYDLFLPASARYLDELARSGLLRAGTRCRFAQGRLAIWWPPGRTVVFRDPGSLVQPSIQRIAMANPSYAPYGRAAQQVLEKTGLWKALYPRLVITDNVRQAFLLVQSGNADVGMVALSLARAAGQDGYVIPQRFHDPIWHEGAVLYRARLPAPARQILAYLCSPAVAPMLVTAGFEPVPTGASRSSSPGQ